jgi:hypothetical protein
MEFKLGNWKDTKTSSLRFNDLGQCVVAITVVEFSNGKTLYMARLRIHRDILNEYSIKKSRIYSKDLVALKMQADIFLKKIGYDLIIGC